MLRTSRACLPACLVILGCVSALSSDESFLLPYSHEEDVAPPCPPPAVDTSGWKRISARSAPISFLLPPGWASAPCRPHHPSVELWCDRPDGNEVTLQVFRGVPEAPDGNPGSWHPTLYFSRCEEEIAGQRVWLSTGIHTGYSHVAHAAGAWMLSDSSYAYLSGVAERRGAVEQALMVLRTVRLEQ